MAPEKEKYDIMWQEAFDEKFRYEKLIKSFGTIMTYEDYKLVRGELHPDRPERDASRLAKAYAIFTKLESTVNKHLPIHELRKRGWAHVSPFHKKTPRST